MGNYLAVSLMLAVHLPYDLALLLFGIYQRELKIYIYTKICTWISAVALFIVAKSGKEPMYIRWWKEKQTVNIHILEHYSAIKRGKNYWYMQKCVWISATLFKTTEQAQKYIEWFPLDENL